MPRHTNHLDKLPSVLRYHIAEYVECKDQKPYPYIPFLDKFFNYDVILSVKCIQIPIVFMYIRL
jgi:hypothetical protein